MVHVSLFHSRPRLEALYRPTDSRQLMSKKRSKQNCRMMSLEICEARMREGRKKRLCGAQAERKRSQQEDDLKGSKWNERIHKPSALCAHFQTNNRAMNHKIEHEISNIFFSLLSLRICLDERATTNGKWRFRAALNKLHPALVIFNPIDSASIMQLIISPFASPDLPAGRMQT